MTIWSSDVACVCVSVRPILECKRESRPNTHSKPAEPAGTTGTRVRPILEDTRESRPNPHSKPAEPAGRVAPAQNQKEVPRGGSAGWRPEPKRSRVGAKRSCRAQRQGLARDAQKRPGSGSLPPRKYPRGSRVFSNSSPIVLSKGARNSDPRSRVKSLEV